MFLPPIPDTPPGSYDLYHPKLRFVGVAREKLNITYDFEKYTKPLIDAASATAGEPLPVPENFVVVPVHELQVHHIQSKFPDATIFPAQFAIPILGQQSIR
jgi:hypothetical protein